MLGLLHSFVCKTLGMSNYISELAPFLSPLPQRFLLGRPPLFPLLTKEGIMGWSELWACYWRAGGEGIQELSYSYIILQNTVICISLRLLIRKVSCFQPRENFFKIARPSFYWYSFSSAGTPRPSLRQTAAQTGKKPPPSCRCSIRG